MSEYPNLDLARAIMSQKSPSDFKGNASQSTADRLDMADASGCLTYVRQNAPTDNPDLMCSAVACYVDDSQRQAFYNEVVKLTQTGYQSKRLRKHHANNLAKAVVIDTVRCVLTDKIKAEILGISKGNFSKNHAFIFNKVSGEIASELSIADDVAGEYWRATFKEKQNT
ncbi:MAG: hypothetical protein Q3971_03195 [Moraxella sp.]|nr:hypothetical protein [Moraxella sp.]